MLSWSIPFGKHWLPSPFPDANSKLCVRKTITDPSCGIFWAQFSGSWDEPHSTKGKLFTSGENRGFNLPDMPLGRWCKVSRHQAEDSSCLQRHSGSKLSAPGWIWFLLLFLHSSYLAGEASVSNWWKAKVILILLWDSVLNCIIYKQRSFFIINGIENQNHQGKLYKSY